MTRALLPRRLARDETAASAAEFAMILPIFLLFLFGIIDVGIYGWTLNRDEKATQMGVRMAAVTDIVATGFTGTSGDYVGQTVGGVTLNQGDPIPAAALGTVTCTSTTCTCTTAPCPASLGYNGTAFTNIVNRMKKLGPNIQPANVLVQYRSSGLGYAGDASCSAGSGCLQISPLATVRLQNMTYTPMTLEVFGSPSVNIPGFSATLPMEDGSGSVSN